MSKNTGLNDGGQYENRYDRYHHVDVTQDISGFLDKQAGFHSKPPKLSLFSGGRYVGSMRSVLIGGFLKYYSTELCRTPC